MQVLFFCDVIEGIRRPRVKKQSGGLFFRGTAPSADGRIPHPPPNKQHLLLRVLFFIKIQFAS